ncbi:anhydro-N-acetylmuramic acid kinase [Aestuariivirga sp.]|uniref:anhydro-N-acetylmuramic acid kinase n=1 Tax=Aestuariivirga sp. TaxID=2650926 RepID=UPI003BACB258
MSKLLTAIGLMSGTSLDGIDVALLRTDGEEQVERGPAATYPYRPDQQALLHDALAAAKSLEAREQRPGILGLAERELTDWHAEAVERFLGEHGLEASVIDVIGFHGQTVIHRPEKRLTVQLGLGGALAERLGIPVVYDMRAADVAAGGQGAPLVPVYHRALAAALPERPAALVNIGGVANMTWVGPEGDLIAFDTGPGNALLNDWCERFTDVAYDRDGALGARGHVAADALAELLNSTFFATAAPKSLDRNSFNASTLDGLSAEDGAATLTRFTAEAVSASSKLVPNLPRLYIICGGGRLNPTLMRDLRNLLETSDSKVISAEEAGFNGDSMEAEAWAYLAVRSLKGLPITFPGTTGAPQPQSGGLIARP